MLCNNFWLIWNWMTKYFLTHPHNSLLPPSTKLTAKPCINMWTDLSDFCQPAEFLTIPNSFSFGFAVKRNEFMRASPFPLPCKSVVRKWCTLCMCVRLENKMLCARIRGGWWSKMHHYNSKDAPKVRMYTQRTRQDTFSCLPTKLTSTPMAEKKRGAAPFSLCLSEIRTNYRCVLLHQ